MKGCVCGPLALLACASDPEATLTASPTSGTAPLEVRFDASGSRDPKGGALTARFDFDSDGIWDTEPSAELSASFRYEAAGTFPAKVEVTRGDGKTAIASISIAIAPNQPPEAKLSVTPASGIAPLEVSLDASASTDPNQEASTLEARFDLDGDGTFETPWGSEKRSATILNAGERTVAVEIRDLGGLVATARQTLQIAYGADLVADTNRDGLLDGKDEANEETWDLERGAVFLANVDDDDQDARRDSADEGINGEFDRDDLTPILVRQHGGLASGGSVTVEVGPMAALANVRIFDEEGTALYAPGRPASFTLNSEALSRADMMLLLEGIQMRTTAWDGVVTLNLTVQTTDTQRDVLALRVSPLIFTDNLRAATELHVMRIDSFRLGPNLEFYDALDNQLADHIQMFVADQFAYGGDRWLQDNMQPGYQMAIGPGGARVMNTFANLYRPTGGQGLDGYVAAQVLRPDSGYGQSGRTRDTSLNYGGNFEVAPPHNANGVPYPFGRLFIGGGAGGTLLGLPYEDHMGTEQRAWLNAQEVQGPAVEVSSEWLLVGHIDETFLFVPKAGAQPGERPWVVVIASPTMAWTALENVAAGGGGNLRVFAGRETETTVNGILRDGELASLQEAAQARLDSTREDLKESLGLTDADFVEVPVLFESYDFDGVDLAAAYNPGIQNLVVTDATLFVPAPEGPVVDGQDVWEQMARESLEALGLTPRFVDVFDSYHLQLGEAHCGTTVAGQPFPEQWWSVPAGRRAE